MNTNSYAGLGRHPSSVFLALAFLLSCGGTGLPRARRAANKIRETLEVGLKSGMPQHLVHLGDVYYAGWEFEYKQRPPPPAKGKTRIEPLAERRARYEMTWPNVIRIDHEYRPQLKLTPERVNRLVLDAYKTPNIAELAPMIDGKPDFTKLKEIDLAGLAQTFQNAAHRL
jgi:hypothetical protein